MASTQMLTIDNFWKSLSCADWSLMTLTATEHIALPCHSMKHIT